MCPLSGGQAPTSQTPTSQPEPTSTEAEETVPPQDSPRDAEPAAQEIAPAQTSPIAGKTVSSCGDPNLHQFGTTFYSDGTSGWSETCNSQMRATWTPQLYPEVEEAIPLGEFVPAVPYIEPTFNPDSGDGYGPDQPLPPLCVRFPRHPPSGSPNHLGRGPSRAYNQLPRLRVPGSVCC